MHINPLCGPKETNVLELNVILHESYKFTKVVILIIRVSPFYGQYGEVRPQGRLGVGI